MQYIPMQYSSHFTSKIFDEKFTVYPCISVILQLIQNILIKVLEYIPCGLVILHQNLLMKILEYTPDFSRFTSKYFDDNFTLKYLESIPCMDFSHYFFFFLFFSSWFLLIFLLIFFFSSYFLLILSCSSHILIFFLLCSFLLFNSYFLDLVFVFKGGCINSIEIVLFYIKKKKKTKKSL